MLEKGIITVAIGKKFAKQAKHLASSCILHSPHIPRAVLTDCRKYLEPYYDIIIDYNKEFGEPFETKTRLDLFSPFKKNLFLDADSLVINNIDFYFDLLDHSSFLYYGIPRHDGVWYFDIEKVKKEHSLDYIPEFNSGMLLFCTNENTKEIFRTANEFMQDPSALNVGFFRGKLYPDEPFLALAFAKMGIKPFEDYGRFSRTLIGAECIKLNVVKGYARFKKYGSFVFPSVVHFCGKLGNFFYSVEKARLFFFTSSYFYNTIGKIPVFFRNIFKKK